MFAQRAALVLAVVCGGFGPTGAADPPGVLLDRARGGRAHALMTQLCDRFGHRLSGSPGLEGAVPWTRAQFAAGGIERAWLEPVLVPHWVRGQEAGRIVAPVASRLALLGLGGTVGTPPGGLTAEVVEADGFEALDALGEAVRGRIVLFNKAIRSGFDGEPGYGSVVKLRSSGPSRAARAGAAGMLLRSLGTASYRLPHTGALNYEDGAPRIPAAAISAEDAELIHRLLATGDTVRVHLQLGAEQHPDRESHNVLAELPGRELPAEIVLIGAHLDSWDVGQGAHDDAAGCAIVIETMRLLAGLEPRPRRTVRAVLFTNEENGLRGAKAYAAAHGQERHVAAIESDSGGARPLGFGVTAGPGSVERIAEIARLLAPLEADRVLPRGGGADISALKPLGVPQVSLVQETTRYFDYHHTEADTVDKVEPADLDRNVAALAVMTWSLAEAEWTLAPLEAEAPQTP